MMVLIWQASNGLYGSGSAGLYASGVADLRKLGREVTGEWRSPWASRLLRIVWLGPEDLRNMEMGGKGKLTCMFQNPQV